MINPINSISFKQLNNENTKAKKQGISNGQSFEFSDYKTAQAILARNNITFRNTLKTDNNVEIILSDTIKQPQINIELNLEKDFDMPKGLFAIYAFAMNDQMYEEINKLPQLSEKGSYIRPASRKLHIECPNNEFSNTLKLANNYFLNSKIDIKHFNNAKDLAPTALFLYKKTGDYNEQFFDIPVEMTENEYCEIIKNISYEDLENYNKNFLKNANTNIQIFMNKKDFENNKEILEKYKLIYKN